MSIKIPYGEACLTEEQEQSIRDRFLSCGYYQRSNNSAQFLFRMLASEFPCLGWYAKVNAPSKHQDGWAEVNRLYDNHTEVWKIYFEYGSGSMLFHALDYAIAYAALDMIRDEQTRKERPYAGKNKEATAD